MNTIRATGLALAYLCLNGCAPALQSVDVDSGTRFTATGDTDGLILDLQGLLWTLPSDGGQARALTTAADDLRRPHLSPDGSLIVAESFATGHWNLVLMSRDGTERTALTRGPWDDREPIFTADGAAVEFTSDRTGEVARWSIDLAKGETTPLKPPALPKAASKALHAPRLSPGGTRLAWVQARERSNFPGVATNELVLYDAASGEVAAVTAADSDVFNTPPTWLEDSALLFAADGRIQKLDTGTGSITTIPFSAQLPLTLPNDSPQSPAAFNPTQQPALGIVDPVVLAGDRIAFTALGDIWLMSADGILTQLTADAWVERDLAASPDGTQLAYISDRNGTMQIWVHDLAARDVRVVLERSRGPRYPTFSPDGTRIAFQEVGPIGTQDFTVRVLDLETGKNRRLRGSPKIWPGRMAWSADGSHITVAELHKVGNATDGRNRLVRISTTDNSSDVVALPDTLTVDSGPVARTDGRQLALISGGSLWQLPVAPDGRAVGDPEQLLDELVESPAWSRDGRRLVFLGPDGLSEFDTTTGRTETRNPPLAWQPNRGTGTQVIHAGRLWDGRSDSYVTNMDVVIEGERIVDIRAHSDHPADTNVIDASAHTVIPGLIDHHVHFEPHRGEWIGRALLAFGVTTVVEPGGLPYESREHFESWLSGRRTGPRLVFAGPQLDGARRTFHFASHIETGERLQRELERGDRLEYGLIKTYRRLRPDLQQQAVKEAHRRGLPITAHAGLRNIGFGGDRTEHLRGSSRTEGSSKQSDLLASYADVRAIYGREGASLTPTLVNQGGYFDVAQRRAEAGQGLDAIATYTHFYDEGYRNNLNAFAGIVERRLDLIRRGLANAGDTLKVLDDSGANLVAGTDSPIFPYGLALVIELQNYTDAGLSPTAALRTATSNAAVALGAGDDVGMIAPGRLADIVIVDGDPLQTVFDLIAVQGVMVNGVYRTYAELLKGPDPVGN